jgi:hypothetical protein
MYGEQLLSVSLHQLVGVLVAQKNQGKKPNLHKLINSSLIPIPQS